MPKSRDNELRARLLARITDYAMSQGLVGRSLSDIAQAVGSSPRMLIYHFGSKENLIDAALTASEERLQARFAAVFDEHATVSDGVRAAWQLLTSEPFAPVARSAFEALGYALNHPNDFRSFLDRATVQWVTHVADALARGGLPMPRARVLATLIVSAINGLLMQRISTGEYAETDQAFEVLLGWIEADAT